MPLTNADVDAAIPVAGTPSRTLTNAAVKTLIADIALKASTASPNLTGVPNAVTAAPGTNTIQIATTAFTTAAITAVVGAAPVGLDTLVELATALGNDPAFATNNTAALTGKSPVGHTHVAANVSDFTAAADARIAAASINALVDVTITAPADNQIIKRVAGVWVNAAEAGGASSQPPVNLTIADFTASNLNLTASLYGNRTLLVNVATAVTVTLNNDATGGWALGDYVDVQAIGVGEVTILQGTATLTTSTGAAADTGTSLSRRVTTQDVSASTWRTLTALASAGGGAGSASFAAAGPSGYALPRAHNNTVLDTAGSASNLLIDATAAARAFADTARGWRPRIGYDAVAVLNAYAQFMTALSFSCGTASVFSVEMIAAIADALPNGAGGGRFFLGMNAGNNGAFGGANEPTADGGEGARIGLMAVTNSSQLVLGIAASTGVATTYAINGGAGFPNDNTAVYSFKVVYQGAGPRRFTWTARNEVTGVAATGVWDGTGGQPALPATADLMRAGYKRATVSGASSAVGTDMFGFVWGKFAV